MARLTVGLVFGFVVGVVAGAAAGLHAQDDEVDTVAAETGKDAIELRGAVNSVGVGPREYLISVGELPATPVALVDQDAGARAPTSAPAVSPVWEKLAGCESTGRWSVVSPPYYGGLQFDLPTWRAYGGSAFAARPDLASPAAQIAVAERLHAVRGFAPWPACSRALGLR